MPIPPIPYTPLTEFFKKRMVYEQRVRDRLPERMNHGDAYNTPYDICVLEEIGIDLLARLERIEEMLFNEVGKPEAALDPTPKKASK